jgi:iron complex transport system ATP-binding protein
MGTNDFELKNVSVVAGKKHLLDRINWTVEPGQRWLLFGRNGSGKTTLLTAMSGYQTITEGTLLVDGEAYSNENVLRLRRGIGLISGSFFDRVYNHESVRDIVLSGLYGSLGMCAVPSDEDVRRLEEALETFNLKRFEYYPYAMLSKGERQRVLIARAMICQPHTLLLDEPCSGLDISSTIFFMDLLKRLVEETTLSLIYVTHRGEEILPAFDQALLLRDGRMIDCGATADVMTDQNMTSVFGFDVRINKEGDHYAFTIPQDAQAAMGQARTREVALVTGKLSEGGQD